MMLRKMILIGVITFSTSACTTKLINVHEPLELENPCVFEKFTETEKDSMTEDVGRKIFRNQKGCEIRAELNRKKAELHNKAHASKD